PTGERRVLNVLRFFSVAFAMTASPPLHGQSNANQSPGKDALGLEHAVFDGPDGNEPAAGGGAGLFRLDRRVAAAHDDRIAEPELGRRIVADRNLREAVQGSHRIDEKIVYRAEIHRQIAALGLAGLAEARPFQFRDSDETLRREGIDLRAAQLRNVTVAAEVAAHVAGERTHIGALSAFDLEHGAVAFMLDDLEPADLDLARRYLHRLALAGEIVSTLAGHLDGRKLRRRLHDEAGVVRQDSPHLVLGWPLVGAFRHRAFEVVRRAFLAPGNREAIDLGPVLHIGHR